MKKSIILWDIENVNKEHYLDILKQSRDKNAELVIIYNEKIPLSEKIWINSISTILTKEVSYGEDAADKEFVKYVIDNPKNMYYLVTKDKGLINQLSNIQLLKTKSLFELEELKKTFPLIEIEKYEDIAIKQEKIIKEKEEEFMQMDFKNGYLEDMAMGLYQKGDTYLFPEEYEAIARVKEYGKSLSELDIISALNYKYIYKQINKKISKIKGKEFKKRNLHRIPIVLELNPESLEEKLKEENFHSIKIYKLEHFLYDISGYYGIDSYPTEIFISKEGNLLYYEEIQHSINTRLILTFKNEKLLKKDTFAII